jgi:hypothetical protein
MKRSWGVFFVGIFSIFVLTGAKQVEKNIGLQYKPNNKVKVTPGPLPPVKIFIEEFKDERPNPQEIGENLEDKGKRVLIVTSGPKGAVHFIQSALSQEFKDKGFSLEDQLTYAVKIIGGSLIKFWTVETNQYQSQSQIRIEVKDRHGQVYYQNTFSGTGKNFGRTLSEANYYESFSDSLAALLDSLFSDRDFLKAIAEKPLPPPPPPAPPAVTARPTVPPMTPAPPVKEPAVMVSPKKAGTPQTSLRAAPADIREPEAKVREGKPSAPVPEPAASKDQRTAAIQPPSQEQAPPPVEFINHKVFAGETMATISKWYSGDTALWPEIAKYNPGLSPFKLNAGEVVMVPLYLATVHAEQPEQSTVAAPAKPAKKPVKGGGHPAAASPPPAPPSSGGPVFGPR